MLTPPVFRGLETLQSVGWWCVFALCFTILLIVILVGKTYQRKGLLTKELGNSMMRIYFVYLFLLALSSVITTIKSHQKTTHELQMDY